MEEKDLTQTLIDKTDALIARHRQARPAVFPTPPEAVFSPDVLPVLTQKVSPEEAAQLAAQHQMDIPELDLPVLPTFSPEMAANQSVLSIDDALPLSEIQTLQDMLQPVEPILSADSVTLNSMMNVRVADSAVSGSVLPQEPALSEPSFTLLSSETLPETAETSDVTVFAETVGETAVSEAAEKASESSSSAETISSVNVLQTENNVQPESDIECIDAICQDIAPELADLVAELVKEVSGAVLRQMTPRIHDIVEKRSRELIAEALRKNGQPPQS